MASSLVVAALVGSNVGPLVSLGIPPKTSTCAIAAKRLSRKYSVCASPPVLLKTTPTKFNSASNSLYPLITAATERAMALQSTTSSTPASSHFAICAVDPSSLIPSLPSYSPITPSTIATSHVSACFATTLATAPALIMYPSRFSLSRASPLWLRSADRCAMGSTKSHPTLNARTRSPRLAYASINAVAIVVFPTPECVPATTTTFIALDRSRALELSTSRPSRASSRASSRSIRPARFRSTLTLDARSLARARAFARPRVSRVAPCGAGANGSVGRSVGRSVRVCKTVGRRGASPRAATARDTRRRDDERAHARDAHVEGDD